MEKGKSLKNIVLRILIISIIVFSGVLVFAVALGTGLQMKKYFTEDMNSKYEAFTANLESKANEIDKQMQIFIQSGSLQWRITNVSKKDTEDYMTNEQKACGVSGIYVVDTTGTSLFASEDAIHKDFDFTENSVFQKGLAYDYAQGYTIIGSDVEYMVVKLNNRADNSTYVVCEYVFTLPTTATYYHDLLGCEYSVYINDTGAVTSITDSEGTPLVDVKINDKKITDTVYSEESPEAQDENVVSDETSETDSVFEDESKIYHGVAYRGQTKVAGGQYISIYSSINLDDPAQKAAFFIGKSITVVNDVGWSVMKLSIPAVIIASVVFVLCILMIFLSIIMNPLSGAAKAIHALAQDTDDADLTYRIEVKSNDEIGTLCSDINKFLDRLQTMMKELKNAEVSLEKIGMNLDSQSQNSADATSEIMTSIGSIGMQTTQQRQVAESANTAMEQSSANVDSLDALIENQSAGITESSASIEEMIGNITAVTASVQKMSAQFKRLMEVTQTGNECQSEVNKQVADMAEQSRLLSEANTVISRIASQTNLLAMNAAIEAAHAGKAGAGFSVVADEIRKLAETSSKQSRAIGDQLKIISGTIAAVVSSSEQSKNAFGTITENISGTDSLVNEIDRAMTEQNSASKQVLSALHDVNTSTSNVRITAKDMKEEIKKVQGDMLNLKQLTDTVSNGMEGMNSKASEVNSSAHTVSDLATDAKKNIVTLQNVVGKFKV